ncbi:hypothetical protein Bbelb_122890 [Branchiostoma belcheri]|nr:hypothetical protein Bbelb_122890 [Branchiostoma belcheri]
MSVLRVDRRHASQNGARKFNSASTNFKDPEAAHRTPIPVAVCAQVTCGSTYRALNIPVFGFGASSYHLSAGVSSVGFSMGILARPGLTSTCRAQKFWKQPLMIMMDVGYSGRRLHEGQSQDGQVVREKVVGAEGALRLREANCTHLACYLSTFPSGVPVTFSSDDYGSLSAQMSDMYMYRRTGGVPVTLPSGDYGFLSTHMSLTDGQMVRRRVVRAEAARVPVTLPSGDYGFLRALSTHTTQRRTGGQRKVARATGAGVPVTFPSGVPATRLTCTDGKVVRAAGQFPYGRSEEKLEEAADALSHLHIWVRIYLHRRLAAGQAELQADVGREDVTFYDCP